MSEWPEVDAHKKRRLIAEHIAELEHGQRPRAVLAASPLARFIADRSSRSDPRRRRVKHAAHR